MYIMMLMCLRRLIKWFFSLPKCGRANCTRNCQVVHTANATGGCKCFSRRSKQQRLIVVHTLADDSGRTMSEGGVVNEANDSLLSNQADSGDSYVGLKKEMREYPREYDCPITQSIMHDPVTASDGHTYERSAIQYWFDTGHNTSPVTNEVLDAQKLYTNHALRKMINSRRIQLGETLIKECLSLSSRPKDSFKKIANIIEKGADLNLRDNKGNTPVSLCTAAGRTDLVQLLIDSDADLLKTNDVGDSALDIAKKRRLGSIWYIRDCDEGATNQARRRKPGARRAAASA